MAPVSRTVRTSGFGPGSDGGGGQRRGVEELVQRQVAGVHLGRVAAVHRAYVGRLAPPARSASM